MRVKLVPINADVAAVLTGAKADGSSLFLQGKLDRALYVATDKVLTALGAKWNRKASCHVFPGCALSAVNEALDAGGAVDLKKTLQFFETPAALAARMAELADVESADDILEPNVGHGRILTAILDRRVASGLITYNTICVDIDPDKCQRVRNEFPGQEIVCADFLEWTEHTPFRFDAIVMNPPFTGNQDISHIRAAWALLRPRGRLVSIASVHGFIAQHDVCIQFRGWLDEIDAHVEDLPTDTFKESGTRVASRLICATKAA